MGTPQEEGHTWTIRSSCFRLAGQGEEVTDADLSQLRPFEQRVILMQQMEHPSFSCWVACSIQAEKLACADSSSCWHFETLMGALLLVPNWVGCSRGNHPSSLKFGKALSFYLLHFPFPPLSLGKASDR